MVRKLDEQARLVLLSYSGKVTPEELNAALVSAVKLAAESPSARYLADCSALEGGHSVFDLYALIDLFDSVGVQRPMREAIVMPALAEAAEAVRFYETACANRGYTIRLFDDVAAARRWLAEERRPDSIHAPSSPSPPLGSLDRLRSTAMVPVTESVPTVRPRRRQRPGQRPT